MIKDNNKKNFREAAFQVLKFMQKRDYFHLDKQMDMAKDDTIVTDLSFGRLALQIPEDHYEVLSMLFPDIQNPDATVKTLAWKEFMASEYSTPYKPNAKQRTM